MLQEPRQQHLVEVGVLDTHDGLVGTAQPAPVQDRVTRRDVERAGDTRTGLLHAGQQGLGLRQHAAATDLLGEGGQSTGGLRRLRDERATSGDALQETFGDQRVERLSYGHPGNAEAGDQLAFGRCRRAWWLGLDEAADVLTDLDMLQRPLTRDDDVHVIHTSQDRTGLDRGSPN